MRWFLASIVFVVAIANAARAENMVFTDSPVNAWRYSFKPNSGTGNPWYVPTSADAVGAVFQSYLEDRAYWGGRAPYSQSASFHVFETYLLSPIDLVLPVSLGGDDGHTLLVDDVTVGGGGFGVEVRHNIAFTGNVPRKVTIIGHNGPGNWLFEFQPLIAGQRAQLRISSVAGLQMNADGDFRVVPEASTLAATSVGAVGLAVGFLLRRRSAAVRTAADRA
jgi:hypothetical protein